MFVDRADAGRRLAARLGHLAGDDAVVLGLPRGGVPVAARVAEALEAPLDVIVVRKLGVPTHRELAMGAIGEDGVRVLNDDVIRHAAVRPEQLADVEREERRELERRTARYRGGHRRLDLTGRTAVIVDDGLATGSTATAACRVARGLGAARVVLAVPVAPTDWEDRLDGVADDLVAVETPYGFSAVGAHYSDFRQIADREVLEILAAHRAPPRESSAET